MSRQWNGSDAPAAPADFSPARLRKSVDVGPSSNTGQKGTEPAAHGALIDYLTVVFPRGRLEDCSVTDLRSMLVMLFGGEARLSTPGRSGKYWQFYEDSAVIFDQEGELVGRMGIGGNRDSVCVSLSGSGCRWVKDWSYTARTIETLRGHITRCDVAYDDYDGEILNVHAMRDRARTGEGFVTNGRPPKSRFLDDHGSGDGCTLYVGAKGHKELCVYEKGRQLGDASSAWVRAEIRYYGKHIGAVPLAILTSPLSFLRGAYPILETLLPGVVNRLITVQRTVEATATAMVKWLRRQTGAALHLLQQALPEEFPEFVRTQLAREQRPGRFRRSGAASDLTVLVRNQLCPS